jgi:hypothetical protein
VGGEHNRIGGDQLGEANTINGTGADSESGAILIAGTEASRNEVAANTGLANFGGFIELVGQGSGNSERPQTAGREHRPAVERRRHRGAEHDRPHLHQDEY